MRNYHDNDGNLFPGGGVIAYDADGDDVVISGFKNRFQIREELMEELEIAKLEVKRIHKLIKEHEKI